MRANRLPDSLREQLSESLGDVREPEPPFRRLSGLRRRLKEIERGPAEPASLPRALENPVRAWVIDEWIEVESPPTDTFAPGFEGPLDGDRHRHGGWKDELPWIQG